MMQIEMQKMGKRIVSWICCNGYIRILPWLLFMYYILLYIMYIVYCILVIGCSILSESCCALYGTIITLR